jgi:hypothetical protein
MIIYFWALLHRHLYPLELMVFIFTSFLEQDSNQMCFCFSLNRGAGCTGNDQQAEQSSKQ